MDNQLEGPKEEKSSKILLKLESIITLSNYLEKINIKDTKKSDICKHDKGCIFNTLNQTFKAFLLGYSSNALINLLQNLVSIKKKQNMFTFFYKVLFNKQILRLSLLPTFYSLIMSGSLCFMRRNTCLSQSLQSFLSGFIAGFIGLATREKSNRKIWALFLLTRAIDSIYNSLVNRGIIRKTNLNYTLIFCAMYILIGYSYTHEPGILPSGFNKFIKDFTFEDQAELAFRASTVTKKNLQMEKRGIEGFDIARFVYQKKQ